MKPGKAKLTQLLSQAAKKVENVTWLWGLAPVYVEYYIAGLVLWLIMIKCYKHVIFLLIP